LFPPWPHTREGIRQWAKASDGVVLPTQNDGYAVTVCYHFSGIGYGTVTVFVRRSDTHWEPAFVSPPVLLPTVTVTEIPFAAGQAHLYIGSFSNDSYSSIPLWEIRVHATQ